MKFLILFLAGIFSFSQSHKLEIEIPNVDEEGIIYIAIYDNAKDFDSGNNSPEIMALNIIEPINIGLYNKTVDLKKGTYAVKVLIDTNGNADIDLNFFGLPKEQFGFSNNVLGHFGAPKFDRTLEAYLPNTNFVNLNDSGASLNRVMPTQVPSGAIVNSLSLYDAQYSSRLGMLLTDNIIKGQENFEIQLEPETFGKVRVSVSMENANLEVKMLAENSAAITALRSSEAILQSITEQNGLKLSDYSVDMQNNASNGGKQGNNEKDNKLPDSSRYGDKEVTSDDIFTNSETSNSLNLLA